MRGGSAERRAGGARVCPGHRVPRRTGWKPAPAPPSEVTARLLTDLVRTWPSEPLTCPGCRLRRLFSPLCFPVSFPPRPQDAAVLMVATSRLAPRHLPLRPRSRQLPCPLFVPRPLPTPAPRFRRPETSRPSPLEPGLHGASFPHPLRGRGCGRGSGSVPSPGRAVWGLVRPVSPSCLPHRTPSHPASTPSLTTSGCHALPPGRVSCSDPTAGPGFQGSASLGPLLPAHPPGASRCPHSGQSAPRGPGCPRGLTWPLAKAFPPKSPLHVLRRALTRLSFVGRNLFPLPSCPSPLALTPLPVV